MDFDRVGTAQPDSVNGTAVIAIDVDFFNSDETQTIYFAINAQFCEYAPHHKTKDANLTQLTGSDSFSTVAHRYKHHSWHGHNKWCSVITLEVLNDEDRSTPDPRIFDIVIYDYEAQIDVKQNIDASLAGEYVLVIKMTDLNTLKVWTRHVYLSLQVIIDCTPQVTPPETIKPYYKYFYNATEEFLAFKSSILFNATEELQQNITLDYTEFNYGNCKFFGVIQLTCQTCAELTSDTILAQMNATATLETVVVDFPQFRHFSVTKAAIVVFDQYIGLDRWGSYNVTYTLYDFDTNQEIAMSTSEIFVTDNSCN